MIKIIKTNQLLIQMLAVTFFISAFASSVGICANSDPARIGPSATLTYLTKESRLTADDKEKLNSLIKEAQTKGSIREFQVAVWSDNPAPRENEQLSKNDRELASRRASLVSKYLRSKSKEGVSSYNMAERASQ